MQDMPMLVPLFLDVPVRASFAGYLTATRNEIAQLYPRLVLPFVSAPPSDG
jgi:hypothetical protein